MNSPESPSDNLLAQVVPDAAPADDAQPVDALAWLPEKHRIMSADGALDMEASAKKLADSYGHLEKRVGSGDLPPKTDADYTLTVPEVLSEHWDPAQDAAYTEFRKEAHATGLTQKQFDFVMGKYFDISQRMAGAHAQLSSQEAVAELRKSWKGEAEYTGNLRASAGAVRAYANPGSEEAVGSYVRLERKFGNDPDFIAVMANIGKEMREDLPPLGSIMPDADIDALQKSTAYWDATDPGHAAAKARVSAHYARKFASAPSR